MLRLDDFYYTLNKTKKRIKRAGTIETLLYKPE